MSQVITDGNGDPLFNIVVGPDTDGQIVFGPYEISELAEKFAEFIRLFVNEAHDPGDVLDGMEIVTCTN